MANVQLVSPTGNGIVFLNELVNQGVQANAVLVDSGAYSLYFPNEQVSVVPWTYGKIISLHAPQVSVEIQVTAVPDPIPNSLPDPLQAANLVFTDAQLDPNPGFLGPAAQIYRTDAQLTDATTFVDLPLGLARWAGVTIVNQGSSTQDFQLEGFVEGGAFNYNIGDLVDIPGGNSAFWNLGQGGSFALPATLRLVNTTANGDWAYDFVATF